LHKRETGSISSTDYCGGQKPSHGLELPAIVEGMETPQQYAMMRSLGCDAAQGYGICQPMEVQDLGKWLNEFGISEVERLQASIRKSGMT